MHLTLIRSYILFLLTVITATYSLQQLLFIFDVGETKNIKNNPVAECAVQELGTELLRLAPEGGPFSPVVLSLATPTLNNKKHSWSFSLCKKGPNGPDHWSTVAYG